MCQKTPARRKLQAPCSSTRARSNALKVHVAPFPARACGHVLLAEIVFFNFLDTYARIQSRMGFSTKLAAKLRYEAPGVGAYVGDAGRRAKSPDCLLND